MVPVDNDGRPTVDTAIDNVRLEVVREEEVADTDTGSQHRKDIQPEALGAQRLGGGICCW